MVQSEASLAFPLIWSSWEKLLIFDIASSEIKGVKNDFHTYFLCLPTWGEPQGHGVCLSTPDISRCHMWHSPTGDCGLHIQNSSEMRQPFKIKMYSDHSRYTYLQFTLPWYFFTSDLASFYRLFIFVTYFTCCWTLSSAFVDGQ